MSNLQVWILNHSSDLMIEVVQISGATFAKIGNLYSRIFNVVSEMADRTIFVKIIGLLMLVNLKLM